MFARDPRPAATGWPASMLADPHLEVIPLAGIEARVIDEAPRETIVSVTASPKKGIMPTLEVATHLATRGYDVVPHLAARSIHDAGELAEIMQQLDAAGVREVFVPGGDSPEPVGDFDSSLQLLRAMADIGHDFTIGITGYPESHPAIPDQVVIDTLAEKQHYASYVISQMCFDPQVLLSWVRSVRARGVMLPIRVGVAGPASSARLVKIGMKVGVGDSMRMLRSHGSGLWKVAAPRSWSPDGLLADIAGGFTDPEYGLCGLHMYTFNAVADTVQWFHDAAARSKGGAAQPEATEMSTP